MEGGTRGLVVVFSAFMIQLLVLGNAACIGIYTMHFLQAFDNNILGVSLVSSINVAVMFGLAPVASMVMNKVAYRKLCLTGAALVSTGLLCMYLFPYLEAMYIFFGVLCGLGGLLIYLPSHVLSGLYYDKHRTMSTGIATAGMGMGALVMPFIVGLLIEQYTWRGSFLVLSAIQLHLFIFAMFMTPPPTNDSNIRSHPHVSMADEETPDEEVSGIIQLNTDSCTYANNGDSDIKTLSFTLPKVPPNETISPLPRSCELTQSSNIYLNDANSDNGTKECFRDVGLCEDGIESFKGHCRGETDEGVNPKNSDPVITIRKMYENDHLTNNVDSTTIPMKTMRTHLDSHLEIFKDFKCVIYMISTFMWCVSGTLFVTFGPDHIHKQGHSAKTTAFLFTFYGLGELFGCIFVSIVGNFFGYRIALYIITCVLTGVSMALVPLVHTFSEFALLLTFVGLPYGGILGLSFIVVIDFVGTDKMDIGLAYVLLATGLGCFTGPPIGAYCEKMWGGYDEAIYLSGLLTTISGLIVLFIYTPRCRSRSGSKSATGGAKGAS